MLKDPRKIISWCLFDFANSSYSAVIASVIFPVYFTTHIASGEKGLGDLWWGRAVALSMFIVLVTSPFLGGIADFGGLKKRFLIVYTIMCVTSVSLFTQLKEGMILEAFILTTVANVGMEGGLVFYNSFLPQIAPKEYQGRISSWGYAFGYVGSILSLLGALPLVTVNRIELVWIMVAIFFLAFSIPAFLYLPEDRKTESKVLESAKEGLKFTLSGLKKIWGERETRKFLIAYMVYEDGLNTVLVFSSIFAASTLGFTNQELIVLYLSVQSVASIGAFLMAKPIDYSGPKKVITLSLLIWTLVCFFAYFIDKKVHFWVISIIGGFNLGTIQAASRALFTQLVLPGKETEYFGVYAMIGKSSAILGPLLFGHISAATGSHRPAVLTVGLFFAVGLALLQMVRAGGPNVPKVIEKNLKDDERNYSL